MAIPMIVLTHGFDVRGHAPLEQPTNRYKPYPTSPPTSAPISSLAIIFHLLFMLRTRIRMNSTSPARP